LHNESHSARFKLMIEAFLAASDDDGVRLPIPDPLFFFFLDCLFFFVFFPDFCVYRRRRR
jgi:hypothetical protein